jgi:hypothetical protein
VPTDSKDINGFFVVLINNTERYLIGLACFTTYKFPNGILLLLSNCTIKLAGNIFEKNTEKVPDTLYLP